MKKLKKQSLLKTVAVSYKNLRAHETKANIVCRPLLEKKKKKTAHIVPEETGRKSRSAVSVGEGTSTTVDDVLSR